MRIVPEAERVAQKNDIAAKLKAIAIKRAWQTDKHHHFAEVPLLDLL